MRASSQALQVPASGVPLHTQSSRTKTSPTPQQLAIPQEKLDHATPYTLATFAFTAQEQRVALNDLFDAEFETIVTNGKPHEYPVLVESFKLKYQACSDNLENIASRLESLGSAAMAKIVRNVVSAESARQAMWLQVQVLKQHLSVASLGDDERPKLKADLQAAKQVVDGHVEVINEALEELRCEMSELLDD